MMQLFFAVKFQCTFFLHLYMSENSGTGNKQQLLGLKNMDFVGTYCSFFIQWKYFMVVSAALFLQNKLIANIRASCSKLGQHHIVQQNKPITYSKFEQALANSVNTILWGKGTSTQYHNLPRRVPQERCRGAVSFDSLRICVRFQVTQRCPEQRRDRYLALQILILTEPILQLKPITVRRSRLNLYDGIEEFTVKFFMSNFRQVFFAGKPWISAFTCKKQKCSILFRTHFTNN